MTRLPDAAKSFIRHFTQLDNVSLDEDGPPRWLCLAGPDGTGADALDAGPIQAQSEGVQRLSFCMDRMCSAKQTQGATCSQLTGSSAGHKTQALLPGGVAVHSLLTSRAMLPACVQAGRRCSWCTAS